MDGRGLCPSCGEYGMVLDEIDGITACDSCGRVGDLAESEFRGEWQIEVDIGRHSVGTVVHDRDGGAAAAKRLMDSRGTGAYFRDGSQGKANNHRETMKKVQSVAAILHVPLNQIREVEYIIERTLDGEWGTGRWMDVLVAACVYVVIRQNQLPLSIPEVASSVHSDAVEVGRMYNRVLRKLGITIPNVDATVFLKRAASEFSALRKLDKDLTYRVVSQATLLLRHMQDCFIFTGRRPLPVVAAALFVALEASEVVVDLAEVAGMFGVGLKVVQSRYRECQGALVGFGQILPWGRDITIKSVNRHVPKLLKFMETKSKIEEKKRKREAISGKSTSGQQSGMAASTAAPFRPNLENSSRIAGLSSKPSDHTQVDKNASASAEEKQPCDHCFDSERPFDNLGQVAYGGTEQNSSASNVSSNDRVEVSKILALNRPPLEKRRALEAGKAMCLACNPRTLCSCRDGFAVKVDLRSSHEVDMGKGAGLVLPGDSEQENIHHCAPEDSESMNKRSTWDGLPAAFTANLDARTRRLNKVNLAKERVFQVRHVLGCTAQSSSLSDFADKGFTVRQNAGSNSESNERSMSLDWEDLTIEHLLLSGASEAEVETGYYKSLLAKYPMNADIGASDDTASYVRSKREVDVLLQLRGNDADATK